MDEKSSFMGKNRVLSFLVKSSCPQNAQKSLKWTHHPQSKIYLTTAQCPFWEMVLLILYSSRRILNDDDSSNGNLFAPFKQKLFSCVYQIATQGITDKVKIIRVLFGSTHYRQILKSMETQNFSLLNLWNCVDNFRCPQWPPFTLVLTIHL